MKTLATISAVLCITVVAAIAAPRSITRTDNEAQRASITVPSRAADFQYGLSGNDWWAGQGRKLER